jgi:hypothetical protein
LFPRLVHNFFTIDKNPYDSHFRWSASSNGGPLESLGYKQGYRVDVDVPDQTWAEASNFHDILIFNTGHWYVSRVIKQINSNLSSHDELSGYYV